MRRAIFAVVSVGLVCQSPPDRAAQAPDTTTDSIPITATTPPPPESTPAGRGDTINIYIDDVAAGNPLVVTGRARTFENTVNLRVRAGGALE